jgi:Methylamine utilisation protein MauE
MAVVEIALRTILAVVFAIAFISKVRSAAAFGEFAGSLGDIGWLPKPGRAVAARLIPLLEAAVVVLLAIPATVAFGFGLGALLLAGFTTVTSAEIANGRRILCRCFGAGPTPIGPAQIARNIVLLAESLAGLAIEPISHGRAPGAALVLAVGLAVLAAVALVRWDDLAYLVRTT